MSGAMKAGELLFELERFRARSSPPDAAFEDVLESFALRVVELRPNRKWLLLGFTATLDCKFRHAYPPDRDSPLIRKYLFQERARRK